MPELQFTCPRCAEAIRCATEMVGRAMHCPTCRHHLTVPSPPPSRQREPHRLRMLGKCLPFLIIFAALIIFTRHYVTSHNNATIVQPKVAPSTQSELKVIPPSKVEFLGLSMRSGQRDVAEIIAMGPEPCILDKRLDGDFSALIYKGNHQLRNAYDTILEFWKNQLFVIIVRYVLESEYEADEKYRILHLKLTTKYGEEDKIITARKEARWTTDSIEVELLNSFSRKDLRHEVSIYIADKQLAAAQDNAHLREEADKIGDL